MVRWSRCAVDGTGLEPSDRAWHKLMDVLPRERWRRIVNKVNHAELIEAGMATRFGPGWPGTRCLAKTRRGTLCQNPAIGGRNRCKLHGGRSTGPRTVEGKARTIAAHTKHGGGPGSTWRRSRRSMPSCGGLPTSLSGTDYTLRTSITTIVLLSA